MSPTVHRYGPATWVTASRSMAHRGGAAMPWKETSPMRERTEFIVEHRSGLYSFSALCEKYQMSRKTGHKSLQRLEVDALEAPRDRSRAPKGAPARARAE